MAHYGRSKGVLEAMSQDTQTQAPTATPYAQQQMCLLLREAMTVGKISLARQFFSNQMSINEAKARIKDELSSYCVVTEAPKTTFGKVRKRAQCKLLWRCESAIDTIPACTCHRLELPTRANFTVRCLTNTVAATHPRSRVDPRTRHSLRRKARRLVHFFAAVAYWVPEILQVQTLELRNTRTRTHTHTLTLTLTSPTLSKQFKSPSTTTFGLQTVLFPQFKVTPSNENACKNPQRVRHSSFLEGWKLRRTFRSCVSTFWPLCTLSRL